MDSMNDDDNALALAAQAGDRAAFEQLVLRHQERVYRVALRLTGERETAFDVAQDVFVKAFRSLDQWKPPGSFVGWLVRLTSNRAIDELRSRKRRRPDRLADAIRQRPKAEHWLRERAESAGDSAAHREIAERVHAALDALSPTQRKVFVLRHYEGMQMNEIAEALETSEGSVKVHLFRAVRKLRPLLADLIEED
jgi:RNA polymerase sigma-70 factor, ECF subfamily